MKISSGVIAYLGPFTPVYRQTAISKWVKALSDFKIPCSSNFSLSKVEPDGCILLCLICVPFRFLETR